MTPLRQRMTEDLPRSGMAARTQELYGRAVHQLAAHDHTSPDQITEEELRDYCLSRKPVKRYARSASTIALCGLTFFSEHPRKRACSPRRFVRAAHEQQRPVILSPQEGPGLLQPVRLMRSPVGLTTISACG
jgi:hypothetical protein